jgi:hypothetical protein
MGEGEREVDRKAMWKNQQRDEREKKMDKKPKCVRKKKRTVRKLLQGKKYESTIDDSNSMMTEERDRHEEGRTNLVASIARSSLPILILFQLLVVVRYVVRHRHESKVRSDCGRCSMQN